MSIKHPPAGARTGVATLAAEPTPAVEKTANPSWDAGVAALQAADAEEFLSPAYMSHSEEAAVLFEKAAQEMAESDPDLAFQAADIAARLHRFLSLDWGNPEDVVTSNDVEAVGDESLTASGNFRAPVEPPAVWFENPNLQGPTPMTITDDGRIYGHIALWGTCHTGAVQHGQCITPPRTNSGYAHFRTGALLTKEGTEVTVGHITIDTKHANTRLNALRAAAHYDHTGHVAADVAVGEDGHGIWFSGALRPGLSDTALRTLRAAPLSGDWRRINGNLELVAALGVNMPGFPVPRTQGLVASGHTVSLVASGMVPLATGVPYSGVTLSEEDMRHLKMLAERERVQHERIISEATTMASTVHTLAAKREVREFVRARQSMKG